MEPQYPQQDAGDSVSAPGLCEKTRHLIAAPGHDSLAVIAEPSNNPAKATNGPTSTPTQNTLPAAPAGNVPFPASAAGAVPGGAELPQVPELPFSAFGSINQFKNAQRMAIMLARSSIVPENYRGDEHLGDCVIALEIANRIGASILAVMQNLRLVQGKPGWSSQFLISCVNASRRFSPIRYHMTGARGEDTWGCIAWATDKTGQLLKSPEVTIRMAKEEGWYYRAGSKWKTMPELMLCYRSATLFARLYAPEITMGIQTTEEVVEMQSEGNGQASRPVFATAPSKPNFQSRSKPEPKKAIPIKPAQQPNSGELMPREVQPTASAAGSVSNDSSAMSGATAESHSAHYDYLKALTGLIGLSKHSETDVLKFLRNTRRCDESPASLVEVAQKQPTAVVWTHDNWKSVDCELSRLKKGKSL